MNLHELADTVIRLRKLPEGDAILFASEVITAEHRRAATQHPDLVVQVANQLGNAWSYHQAGHPLSEEVLSLLDALTVAQQTQALEVPVMPPPCFDE